MKYIRLALIALFLCGGTVGIMVLVSNKPRILVLQSYDPEYSWTRDIDVGLRRVLDGKSRYSIRWFYMDTKRHPWLDFKQKAGALARRTIDDWQPNVIIAIDDDAQEFAAQAYINDPKIRIVHAGINAELEAYGYDKANNVTGILERQKLDAVKDAILGMAAGKGMHGPIRVMLIGDTSETVAGDAASISAYDWSPITFVGVKLVGGYGPWRQAVDDAADKVDFILTTNYRGLVRNEGAQELVPPGEVVAWTEAHAKPVVVGTYGFYVEDGGTVAIGTSPYEQGEVAARMAVDVISGKPIGTIPLRKTEQFVVYMRGRAMRAKGIVLPPIYEAFARATKNYFDE